MEDIRRLTKREIIDALSALPDDVEIDFGSTVAAVPLEFSRFKRRGDKLMCIELNERFPKPGRYSVTVADDMGSYELDTPDFPAT